MNDLKCERPETCHTFRAFVVMVVAVDSYRSISLNDAKNESAFAENACSSGAETAS